MNVFSKKIHINVKEKNYTNRRKYGNPKKLTLHLIIYKYFISNKYKIFFRKCIKFCEKHGTKVVKRDVGTLPTKVIRLNKNNPTYTIGLRHTLQLTKQLPSRFSFSI